VKGSFEYWTSKIGSLFLTQFTPSSFGVGFFLIGILSMKPCMPPHLGSIFLEKDGTCSAYSTGMKTIYTITFGLVVQGYAIMEVVAFAYLVMEYVYIVPLAGLYMYISTGSTKRARIIIYFFCFF
jgi:hypothetical protein